MKIVRCSDLLYFYVAFFSCQNATSHWTRNSIKNVRLDESEKMTTSKHCIQLGCWLSCYELLLYLAGSMYLTGPLMVVNILEGIALLSANGMLVAAGIQGGEDTSVNYSCYIRDKDRCHCPWWCNFPKKVTYIWIVAYTMSCAKSLIVLFLHAASAIPQSDEWIWELFILLLPHLLFLAIGSYIVLRFTKDNGEEKNQKPFLGPLEQPILNAC